MAREFPDPAMQALLSAARRCSAGGAGGTGAAVSHQSAQSRPAARPAEIMGTDTRRPSHQHIDNLIMEDQRRRLSEAGVNRRPSAAHVLTEDTDSFIIGQRVYVDGVKPGRIQFIGETKFGAGEWAGVFLDEPIGKNDGSVMSVRYFTCEPRHGVFSRLYRLTREPIEGAEEILNQCRRFGYEILDAPTDRRGSMSGGSRRGSVDRGSLSPRRGSTPESRSPRRTPEPYGRGSPDPSRGDRRSSNAAERRGSLGIPARKFTPGKSPLASPHNYSRQSAGSPRIERDPDIERLASEARRLSLGGAALGGGTGDRRGSEDRGPRLPDTARVRNGAGRPGASPRLPGSRRQSETPENGSRRSSESQHAHLDNNGRASPLCHLAKPPSFARKQSEQTGERRGSYSDQTQASLARREGSLSRRGSGAGYDSLPRRGSGAGLERRGSSARRKSEDIDPAELQRRRLSEAGLRRPSATDVVLNEATDYLMVGQEVWVDGTKKGRIAYIGTVHFAKGEMAGVHLDSAVGKNNGTVGGILYFQTEPRHGLFSRLHRLALHPLTPGHRCEE